LSASFACPRKVDLLHHPFGRGTDRRGEIVADTGRESRRRGVVDVVENALRARPLATPGNGSGE
jgi:hypothetical protein